MISVADGDSFSLKRLVNTVLRAMGVLSSEEQWKKGQERIKEYGLEGQVEIELIDYRDVAASGRTFDRIVSIGMLEHVGRPNFPLYMEDASDMLKDGGLFLLHYISDPSEKGNKCLDS